jgi:hypothetical protein
MCDGTEFISRYSKTRMKSIDSSARLGSRRARIMFTVAGLMSDIDRRQCQLRSPRSQALSTENDFLFKPCCEG